MNNLDAVSSMSATSTKLSSLHGQNTSFLPVSNKETSLLVSPLAK
ncbi:hypothetical protein BTN49_1547 [Candidatus Enterovibrio escicola]|uniref:Uncharacterized protein n=1 Tax=Candidatus Enterovibrio escicola TaxID=1927127 RepID=A0A2A5T4E4_9GAMM|nr:hypothetical protein [Candidatus Enterovibrio escacola]PCS22988.1 hypothetical protein BTN49_1547 [Candidatus Enterovibrio escacola]